MGAGRPQGLRQPGLRLAFDPSCGCDDETGGDDDDFTPGDIAGLFLDLNPAEGVTVNESSEVTRWDDQGTSGSDVVTDDTTSAGAPFILSQTAFGGLPGLVGDSLLGSSLKSESANPVFPLGGARTVFVVARVLQADDGCIFVSFQPSGGLSRTFALGLWNFGNAGTLYPYTDGITISQATPLGPGAYENETKVYAYRFTGAGKIQFSVNGSPFVALTGTDFGGEDGPPSGTDGYFIGRFIGTTYQGAFKGTLGRILGYNSALSDEDAQRVSAFLLDRFGVIGAIVADDISDSGATGRDVIRSATQEDARTAIDAQRHFTALDQVAAALSPVGLAVLGSVDELDAQQIIDSTLKLSALAGLSAAADKLPYFTGAAAMALADFPGAARTLLAATTEAAQRAALGIVDLTDEATAELAHAIQVCGFTKPSHCKTFHNIAKIGTLGNDWTILSNATTGGLGNSGKGIVTSGWRGGANQLAVDATAGRYANLISCVNGLALYGGAFMDGLVGASSKWHVETVIRLDTAPDATTEIGIGWIGPAGEDVLLMGVRGNQSTDKFRLFRSGTATGINSTVDVDIVNPHRLRMWGNGDGKIYFSVDNETPIELTGYVWTWGAAPYVNFTNGATGAAPAFTLGTTRYRAEGIAP